MRRSVVRLIAAREIRDQLRDRRTLFLILGLPVLMYPLFVGVGHAVRLRAQGEEAGGRRGRGRTPAAAAARTSRPVAGGAGRRRAPDAARSRRCSSDGKFPASTSADDPEGRRRSLVVKPLDAGATRTLLASRRGRRDRGDRARTLAAKLERGERPAVRVLGREGEENSKLAVRRVTGRAAERGPTDVKAARFARAGLPPDFDSPVDIRDPQSDKPTEKKVADELRDVLVKVIPFLLVMWMLTGAIYPAIDMTAGEKERGTMETLLISPAERTEIVVGKFLAVDRASGSARRCGTCC